MKKWELEDYRKVVFKYIKKLKNAYTFEKKKEKLKN